MFSGISAVLALTDIQHSLIYFLLTWQYYIWNTDSNKTEV